MVSNFPRNHYVHVYLEDVASLANYASVELEIEVEPEIDVEEDVVNDSDHVEHVDRVDGDSGSEDSGYDNSDFSDSKNDYEDEVSDVRVGVNVDSGNVEGRDEVRFDSNPNSEHFDSLHSLDGSDSYGPHRKYRYPEFNTIGDISNPTFKVGLIFATKLVLKEAVKMYSIKNMVAVRLKRNDNKRIQVVCKEGCPWVLWASPIDFKQPYGTWQVLKQVIFKDFSIHVHLSKGIRAKNLALEKLHGNLNEQYTKLYDYLAELRSSNPGTTTILQLDESVFKRLYICRQAMKDGLKAGCRPIICLDGCHLKGYYKGHLLAAVGQDADDCLYPLAFAIVDSECESAWTWFLDILKNDLELNNSHHISFMTDRQKGLMESVMELFPYSEHRTCVRHLYNNFKLAGDHKGKALKDQLWKAARATYVREFEVAMVELEGLSSIGHLFLLGKDPRQWTKSHFSFRSKSDILLNNHCESFNKMILEARDKGIITLVESIRSRLMQRIAKKKDEAEKLTGILYPKIQRKLDNAITQSHRCWPLRAGGSMYQVSCGPSDQHSVNIQAQICSCRKWELTVSTQMVIYSHFISPVRGENQWTPHQTNLHVLSPIIRRPPGRPNKTRRREPDEAPPQGGKMTKNGVRMSCKKCGGYGHNVWTCKGPVGGNTRPQQEASNSTQKRAPRPKLPVRQAPTPSQFHGQNQSNIPRPNKPPPPVHIVRWMPTPTFPSSQESSVSQSSTPVALAQKKSRNDP
ncbi:hypothetical protein V6N13_005710 [Hibiscus sabdariffa]